MKKSLSLLTFIALLFFLTQRAVYANPTVDLIGRRDLFTLFDGVPFIATITVYFLVVFIEAGLLKLVTKMDIGAALLYSTILNAISAMMGVILTAFWGGTFSFLTYLLCITLPVFFRKTISRSFLEKRGWVLIIGYVSIWFGLPIGHTGLGQLLAGFGIALFTEVAFALQYMDIGNPYQFSKGILAGNLATHLLIGSLIPLLGKSYGVAG